MRLTQVGALVLAVVAVAACGGPSSSGPTQAPTSMSTTAPASVRVVVDTSKSKCVDLLEAKPGTCFLPIYSLPTYDAPSLPVNWAPASKCTSEDESKCWPQPKTELKAVCKKDGMRLQDSVGRGSSTWLAVVVPPEELLIDRTLLPSTAGTDEVVGFAPEIWLRRLTQDELPSCERVIANG